MPAPSVSAAQWAICLGIAFIGLFNALPHLGEALWQDEAATLVFHAAKGIAHPFEHYGTPNNHIAFSSMLAGWRQLLPGGHDVSMLRLLPLALFLAAIPATFLAAHRLGGALCAALATVLFAGSAVAGNFATQLRGYGPSWLFAALALWCALNAFAPRRQWAWRAGYALATLVGIAMLPTNVFFAMITGCAVAGYHLLDPARRTAAARSGLIVLVVAPPVCLLLAYGAVWGELMLSRQIVASEWTRADLLRSWSQGTLADYRWLLPVAGAAVAIGLRQALRRDERRDREDAREMVLALVLLLGMAIAVLAMPHAPFPRTLVPYLPVWYCALGFLLGHGKGLLVRGANAALFVAALAAFALPMLAGPAVPSCRREQGTGAATAYDLCHQYFRDRYHPDQVLQVWASLGRQDVPIATNFEGYHALRALGSPARIHEFRHYPAGELLVPLIVAHDEAEQARMGAHLGLARLDYRLVADTGYFKVYAPSR